MKIIVLIKLNPFFENSASANRWRTLLEGLSDLGQEILILITGGYNSTREFKKLGRFGKFGRIEYRYFSLLFQSNIWLRRINNYLLGPAARLLVTHKIKKAIKNYPQAILWTSSDLDAFQLVVDLKNKLPGLKTFLEMSEFLDFQNLNKGRAVHRIEGAKRQAFFEKKAYFAYDALALMTNTLMKHYSQFPKPLPKLLHLPMTVDLDRFTKIEKAVDGFDKPYIAYIGVMNDAKDGVNILIQAFSLIIPEFPDYKLYLVGGWNYDTPSHQKLIKELGLEDAIFWKGEFQRDQIPLIIMNAALLVLPRPDTKQTQGGFPTKLGEYLATGNPVCATRVGEIPDYLIDGESVYFAEPGSVNSFSEAMHRALSNPEDAKRVGINGRKVAEKHFNKDIQAKILYDFLIESFYSK